MSNANKTKRGMYFPKAGEFYSLLPYILRSQDGGFLLAFTELIRASHNWAKEDARVLTSATNPLEVGQHVTEHYGESQDELDEFLDRVESGDASLSSPPTSLRFSVNSINRLRKHIGLAASNVSSEVPLDELAESVARRVVQVARTRHQTRGSRWLSENVGRMLGLGDLRITELWSRATLSNPSDVNDSINNDDLSETPEKYPSTGPDQVPIGSPSWNQWDYSDSGEYETQEYVGMNVDPFSASYFKRTINGRNPWVSITDGRATKPLASGVYHLEPGKFASVKIPYYDGKGHIVVSSILPGNQGTDVSVDVGIYDGYRFSMSITGPKSQIKYKSSIYTMILYVDLMTTISLLDFDGDGVVDLDTLSRPLNLLFQEEFLPLTRILRNAVSGVGFRDQINYAPHHPVKVLALQDDNNDWWTVTPIPTVGIGNYALEMVADDRPYALTESTAEEISEAQAEGEVIQWDHVRRRHYRFGLNGTGASSRLVFEEMPEAEPFSFASRVIYVEPWFVWVQDGILEVRGTRPEEFSGYMLTGGTDDSPIEAYLSSYYEEIRDEALSVMTVDATPPEDELELMFSDRPQDALGTRSNAGSMRDHSSFYVEHGWSDQGEGRTSSQTWWDYLDRESGADIRMRMAGVHGAILQDPGASLTLRNQPISFLDRHGRYVWRALINPDNPTEENHPLLTEKEGDNLTYTGLTIFDGPQEGSLDTEPEDGLVLQQGWILEPNGKVFSSYPQISGTYKVLPRNDVFADYSDDGSFVGLTVTSGTMESVPASIAIPDGDLAGVHEVDVDSSTTTYLLLKTPFTGTPSNVQILFQVGRSSSLESGVENVHTIKFTFGGAADVSYLVATRDVGGNVTTLDSSTGSSSKQLTRPYTVTQGDELVVYLGCSDSFSAFVTADLELEIGDLSGRSTWSSTRDVVQVLKYVRKVDGPLVGTDSNGDMLVVGRHEESEMTLLSFTPGSDAITVSSVSAVSYDPATNLSALNTGAVAVPGANGQDGTLTIDDSFSGESDLFEVTAVESNTRVHFDQADAPSTGDLVNVEGTVFKLGTRTSSTWNGTNTYRFTSTIVAGDVTPDLTSPSNSLEFLVPKFSYSFSGKTTLLSLAHGLTVGDAVQVAGKWHTVTSVPEPDVLVIDKDSGFETGTSFEVGDNLPYSDGTSLGTLSFEKTVAS